MFSNITKLINMCKFRGMSSSEADPQEELAEIEETRAEGLQPTSPPAQRQLVLTTPQTQQQQLEPVSFVQMQVPRPVVNAQQHHIESVADNEVPNTSTAISSGQSGIPNSVENEHEEPVASADFAEMIIPPQQAAPQIEERSAETRVAATDTERVTPDATQSGHHQNNEPAPAGSVQQTSNLDDTTSQSQAFIQGNDCWGIQIISVYSLVQESEKPISPLLQTSLVVREPRTPMLTDKAASLRAHNAPVVGTSKSGARASRLRQDFRGSISSKGLDQSPIKQHPMSLQKRKMQDDTPSPPAKWPCVKNPKEKNP